MTKPETIKSTDDARVENTFGADGKPTRHSYRVLTDDEKEAMQEIKDFGAAFLDKLHEIGGTDPSGEAMGSRDLAIARTHVEDAVMRTVRHITA